MPMKRAFFVIAIALLIVPGTYVRAEELSYDVIAEQRKQDIATLAIAKVVITPASTAVRIEWDTDVPSLSYLEYGRSPAYGLRVPLAEEETSPTRNHRVEISALSEFQTYHFRIHAQAHGSSNELYSRPLTFTTHQAGGFSEKSLSPTPADFSAPRVVSLVFDQRDVGLDAIVATDEPSFTRIEYGAYVKGAQFNFEEKVSSADRRDTTRLPMTALTPGSLYLYRLTTQDRYGNRAFFYGTLDAPSLEPKSGDVRVAGTSSIPKNSVLITHPSQLAGIPQEDLWKEEKSGRVYRIFRTMPPNATILTHPSQLTGLTSFQIWRDGAFGRLYRHAGIPNPEHKSKETSTSKESSRNKESIKNKEIFSSIPKEWIRLTHPLQLKVLFPHEVWRDPRTGALYRMVGKQKAPVVTKKVGTQIKPTRTQNTQKSESVYIPFSR